MWKIIKMSTNFSLLHGLGMNDVSLQTFLHRQPTMAKLIFPTASEKLITAEDFVDKITYEDKESDERNGRVSEFLLEYIREIETRKEGTNNLCLTF